ncbi:hypothetical protein COLO4_29836 [Corchorus olitorius]|uniref:DUF668 domain-containing protein n=1 Tax=Corchorus olitorius TaxID=93759 RepID=A0A1R3HD04_9ROSI|nr:hypothetical protein COLO4_29836 [Corchorus olitorius]
MVIESWFGGSWWNSRKSASESPEKEVLGILAFEVASLMSKVVNLWHSLDDREISKFKEDITDSIGIQRLVSDDENYLMDLALNEIIENFGNLSKSVARLGKKCSDPVYHRFEHFINDPVLNNFEWFGWEYRWKKMERKVKKMERFVAVTMQLTQELEVLAELEQTLRRMQRNAESDRIKLFEFQQKVMWQRQEVKHLRETSPWVRTYDYIVRLLLRSLLTIFERIKMVFGTNQVAPIDGNDDFESINSDCLSRSHSFSTIIPSSVYPADGNLCGFSSGPLGRSFSKSVQINDKNRRGSKHLQSHYLSTALHGKHPNSKTKKSSHGGVGPFKGCMSAGSDSPILESCKPIGTGSMRFSSAYTKNIDKISKVKIESLSRSNKIYTKLSIFRTKRLLNASPSTLGNAALSLRYANVIILIEKLVSSPHLIGLDARDDLYSMLPTSMKNALRAKLKSYSKTFASFIYDASLAAQWNLALMRILEWLAPLAHNMIRWQSERNFEQQHVVSRSNVLLVQTLHFANQAKTEAAITELLVGLNYVCRVARAHNGKALQNSTGTGAYSQDLPMRDDIR